MVFIWLLSQLDSSLSCNRRTFADMFPALLSIRGRILKYSAKRLTVSHFSSTNNLRKASEYSKNPDFLYKEEDGYCREEIEDRFASLSTGGCIDVVYDDAVATVTINNPRKRNSFTGEMLVQFQRVTEELWHWNSGKAVVLVGAENNFCSGLDFAMAKKLVEPEDGPNMCMYMQNTLTLFQELPLITVAAVKGSAIGGGAEVITACDFRILFPNSKIQFVQKKIGIIPGWGGATRLRQIVGRRIALHLLASSQAIEEDYALSTGLADGLVCEEGSTVADTAKNWLEDTYQLQETDPSIFKAIKRAAAGSIKDLYADELRREKKILGTVWGKSPNIEALKKIKST